MSTLRRSYLIAISAGLVPVLNAGMVAQSPTLDDVLSRLHDYLVTYEERLSTVVADEEYEQRYEYSAGRQSVTQTRVLRSDFVFLRLPGERSWLGFRDTFLVDGRPVRNNDTRLPRILTNGGDDALRNVARIAAENARYNLGDFVRTVNVPTQVLELLHPRHRSRFSFRKIGEETIDGRRLWRIGFREISKPSLIKTREGANQLASGTVLIDSGEGAVVQTVLDLGGDLAVDFVRTKITVQFGDDAKLGFRVPTRMAEVYNKPGMQIVATATYTNFRQFQTSVGIVSGQ